VGKLDLIQENTEYCIDQLMMLEKPCYDKNKAAEQYSDWNNQLIGKEVVLMFFTLTVNRFLNDMFRPHCTACICLDATHEHN